MRARHVEAEGGGGAEGNADRDEGRFGIGRGFLPKAGESKLAGQRITGPKNWRLPGCFEPFWRKSMEVPFHEVFAHKTEFFRSNLVKVGQTKKGGLTRVSTTNNWWIPLQTARLQKAARFQVASRRKAGILTVRPASHNE
jgi:hypothetical protein